MNSFKEVIYFIKLVILNKATFKITDERALIVALILCFKDKEYKAMFIRFLMTTVKKKTPLYNIVLSEFKTDSQREMTEGNFIGRFGVKGNGLEELKRIKDFIYQYGKFNTILKVREEELWL